MLRTFTNEEIYNLGNILSQAFNDDNSGNYIPAKMNFLIHKNKKTLVDCAVEIEKTRLDLIQKYGSFTEDGVTIPPEHIGTVNKELSELLSIEQELNIYNISFEDLENVQFTSAQMEALMFMIDDPAEDNNEQ